MYWACSVSTCNRPASSYVFCTVDCWDAHVPTLNHRNPWCSEKRAPTESSVQAPPAPHATTPQAHGSPQGAPPSSQAAPPPGSHAARRAARLARSEAEARRKRGGPATSSPDEKEILIVASRLKGYIDRQAGMNTSADVLVALSDIVRTEADRAIEHARNVGRKTVMARDFK
jgi:hypothetical protein